LPEELLATLAPLVRRSRQIRRQARQQRADAAELRSLAMYQTSVAEQERARSSDLRAALLSHRASQRKRL
jgi:hypothetical protein